jgi:hypothetical protein
LSAQQQQLERRAAAAIAAAACRISPLLARLQHSKTTSEIHARRPASKASTRPRRPPRRSPLLPTHPAGRDKGGFTLTRTRLAAHLSPLSFKTQTQKTTQEASGGASLHPQWKLITAVVVGVVGGLLLIAGLLACCIVRRKRYIKRVSSRSASPGTDGGSGADDVVGAGSMHRSMMAPHGASAGELKAGDAHNGSGVVPISASARMEP